MVKIPYLCNAHATPKPTLLHTDTSYWCLSQKQPSYVHIVSICCTSCVGGLCSAEQTSLHEVESCHDIGIQDPAVAARLLTVPQGLSTSSLCFLCFRYAHLSNCAHKVCTSHLPRSGCSLRQTLLAKP